MVCYCNDPVNPFLDIENSRIAIFHSSVKDGDTVDVFSTESISVAVYLREHISKYTVSIKGNRLWKKPDSTINQEMYTTQPQSFLFSYSDTGLKVINVSAMRDDGKKSSEQISLYVKSPLMQSSIIAQPGDSILLSTPKVKDPVTYVWNLKNSEIVTNKKESLYYKLGKMFTSSIGELYVTDSVFRSPSYYFSLSDPQVPFLVHTIISENYNKDTITTVDHDYKLVIDLSGTKSLKSATVNNIEFDVEKTDSLKLELSALITIPGTGTSNILPLYIEIVDGMERVIRDTLYLHYVEKVKTDFTITVLEPSDSSIVNDSICHMYGIISGTSAVKGFIYATINKTGVPIAGKLNQNVWSFKLKLVPGNNEIHIGLFPDSSKTGNAIASTIHSVRYLPSIIFASVNDSVSGDTVFTGTTFLDFQIMVTAPFQIKDATVNETSFDNFSTQGTITKLTKYISGLDPKKGAYPVNVEVTSESGQKFAHIFYIVYDKNVQSNLPNLTIVSPQDDTVFTNENSLRVHGSISNHLQYNDVYLFASVNGVYSPAFTKPQADSSWDLKVLLTEGWNKVTVLVFEDTSLSSTSLQDVVIYVRKSASFSDTVKPTFVLVQRVGDSSPLSDIICDTNSLDLKIVVSDNIGVSKVNVNHQITARTEDSINFFCSVPLLNNSTGNKVVLYAYDKNNNMDSVEYIVRYNRKPAFTTIPEPQVLSVDSIYKFKVQATDPDGNVLSLTIKIDKPSRDTIISIGPDGYFSWAPALSDTGRRTLTFIAWDGMEQTEATVSMVVVVSKTQAIPVAWKTKPQEVTTSFTAGIDTVDVLLTIDSLTGKQPFNFTAKVGSDIADIKTVGIFTVRVTWVPGTEDIGFRTLSVIVADSAGFKDTLAVTLKIASPSPLTISWTPSTASFTEKDEQRVIKAALSGPAPSQITVQCALDWLQSSIGRSDITMPDTSYLTFAPGQAVCSLVVKINDDDEVETDEQFVISFTSMPPFVRQVTGNTFTGKIKDDDNISFSFQTSGGTGNEASGKQLIPIIFSKPVLDGAVIDCVVDSLSSANLSDFVLNTKRIVIPKNQTTANIEITINNDEILENDEAIKLSISSQTSKMVPGQITNYTYSVIDDDVNKSEVYFSFPDSVVMNEGDMNGIQVVVNLSQELGVPLNVYYSIASASTAKLNNDFTLSPVDSVYFEPGSLIQVITVVPVNNTRIENEEFLEIDLTGVSNANAAAIGQKSKKKIIIKDNDFF
jgi:hypothetical protein